MHRFVLTLCLVIAPFEWHVDPAEARACLTLRTLPGAASGWCVQAPSSTLTLARFGRRVASALH